MVTPSSWHQLLTYSNRAVFDVDRERAAVNYFDKIITPKLQMPGRRERLLNAYTRLEKEVPDDVMVNWFPLETKRRGLEEHAVTVTEMDKWRDWATIIEPYEVGMGAYDGAVRSIAHSHEQRGKEIGVGLTTETATGKETSEKPRETKDVLPTETSTRDASAAA
jgi:hypothetical protein